MFLSFLKLQCTYLLVLHYLKSSMLLSRYVEVGTTIAKRKQNSMFDSLVEYPLYTDVSSPPSRDGPRAGRGGYAMVDYVLSCCPHEIQILQLPVFDMLRVMFTRYFLLLLRRFSISYILFVFRGESSTSNRQILGLAIEVWLLWTQPWNATEIAAGKRKFQESPLLLSLNLLFFNFSLA